MQNVGFLMTHSFIDSGHHDKVNKMVCVSEQMIKVFTVCLKVKELTSHWLLSEPTARILMEMQADAGPR